MTEIPTETVETTTSGLDPWIGVAGAILVFLAGLALGPYTKSYEALFLEQWRARRLLRSAARESMHQLGQVQFQKFQLGHRNAVHKAKRHLQDAVTQYGSQASAKDEAVAEALVLQMKRAWEAGSADAYAESKAAAYPLYLDVKRRRRWLRRRAALRARQPKIRKDNFVKAPPMPQQHRLDDRTSELDNRVDGSG